MNTITRLLIALCVTLLAACSDPKIDASTEESMKASVAQVRESLPAEKRDEFDKSLALLALNQINFADMLSNSGSGADVEAKMRQAVDGKTGDEIIAAAARVEAERKAKEREQALQEIAELQIKQQQAESARAALASFEVTRSRFYKEPQRYGSPKPVIELSVKNGTEHAVARAYFEGTIASPGRSVPWLKDTFNYSISGGLEPGEEAKWSLAPNMFSKWGSVEAPEDAIFTVIAYRLDGVDGEPLLTTDSFSERDAKRLAELQKQYQVEAK